MSEVQSAMLMLVAATLAFVAIVYFIWRRSRPATELRAPKMPRAPREPGQSRLPRMPRRDREVEAPVAMSAARLARISNRAPLDRLTDAEPDADLMIAERPAPAVTPPTEADKAIVSQMLESMVAQVQHEADLIEHRGSEPVALRLVPQIPPRPDAPVTSWLGGRPRLPAHMAWPEIREVPGDFLAQISCADLPRDLWDGLGPREGALAFFIHPCDYDVAIVHVPDGGEATNPPHPLGHADGWFAPHGGLRFGDLMPFARSAFPEWPIDLVAVRPGTPDPRGAEEDDEEDGAESAESHGSRLYRTGYDIADPAFHPFDWPTMTAMVEILAMRIDRFWREVEGGPSPIDVQLANLDRRLAALDDEDGESEDDPADRERLENQHDALTELARASDAAAATNRAARIRAEEIIAIVRESATKMTYSATDAAAVMDALHAIHWTKVNRKADPAERPGAELIESLDLPLTTHHRDAPLWVHDYQSIWFDHAKHAYAANPAALSDAARALFEPYARDLAAREMGSIGHVPFRYVHDYDEESHATLLELPSSGLMSWMFGDVDHLVLTLRKADLAAGRFDRPLVQVSN